MGPFNNCVFHSILIQIGTFVAEVMCFCSYVNLFSETISVTELSTSLHMVIKWVMIVIGFSELFYYAVSTTINIIHFNAHMTFQVKILRLLLKKISQDINFKKLDAQEEISNRINFCIKHDQAIRRQVENLNSLTTY